jgi:lysophospholipase L1-like esterase
VLIHSNAIPAPRRATAHRRRLCLVALAVAAVALFAAPGAATASSGARYVALGDSYTAGPAIPNQIATNTPLGCAQSDHNYPHLVAAVLHISDFTDVSCSNATTNNMTQPQVTAFGTNAPQFDALGTTTKLVTVGIGGNDIGFSSIIGSCLTTTPVGHPCQDLYVQNGVDLLQQRIDTTAPKIAGVLQGIHTRSPHARVVLVGYLDILPLTGPGCFPQVPFAPDDVPYLNGVEVHFNQMLAQQARLNHAGYANSYAVTIGHDACQSPTVRWVEPLTPANPAAPFHPNAKGHQATAAATLLALLL